MDTLDNVPPLSEPPAVGAEGGGAPVRSRLDDINRTIWLTRPDLRALCNGDREQFAWWLLLNGTQEYRALAEASDAMASDGRLAEPADEALPGVRPALTRPMLLVWRMRRDLHPLFDLRTAEGQQGFVRWLLIDGARESEPLARIAVAACRTLLSQPARGALPAVQPALTAFMHVIWTMRPDLQSAFDLDTAEGQRGFVRWYFTHGPAELGLARYVTDEQKRLLNAPDESLPGDAAVRVSRLMALVWQQRPDIQQAFPLDDPTRRAALVDWFFTHGIAEMRLAGLVETPAAPGTRGAPPSRSAAGTRTPLHRPPAQAPAIRKGGALPFGVNLIGSARGQFGIGEDVRMAALAMRAANIPFVIHNVEPGREVCQGDDSVEAFISDGLPYTVNVLCTTGFETARLAAAEGTRLFDGRCTIGYWPWELPEWPEDWRHAYNLVDEVWASSRYTYEAYARSSPKPVRHVPMAVSVDPTTGLRRRDFGLSEDRFLFVFSFDILSSLSRKNPHAVVRSFKRAFRSGNEAVGLVLKVMRAAPGNPVWQALLEEAGSDRRISVINATLSRGAVLDLYRACDVFVSLHRAEGFGRGIAEAMMLGKPVVVTGFSGNMDFTTPGTAALTNHRMRPVGPDEYAFASGQSWAEPEEDHAAWWMRRLFEDAGLRQRLAQQGRLLATATYAPEVVGAGYAALLKPPRRGTI